MEIYMIKKIFLSIIIFLLIMPGIYFYARGLSGAGSEFGFTKENRDIYKGKSKLDSTREEEMRFISNNITRLLPPGTSPDGIQFVNRFWFVKNSYKEVYVEYGYRGVKSKILVHVIRHGEGDDEKKIKNLFKYILLNYFEFGKGGGWKLRQVEGEQLALDLKKQGFYENEPLEILTYILKREKKKGGLYTILHLNLMVYLTTAYFEATGDSWQIKEGKDISKDKDLELYKYECEGNAPLNSKWVKREIELDVK